MYYTYYVLIQYKYVLCIVKPWTRREATNWPHEGAAKEKQARAAEPGQQGERSRSHENTQAETNPRGKQTNHRETKKAPKSKTAPETNPSLRDTNKPQRKLIKTGQAGGPGRATTGTAPQQKPQPTSRPQEPTHRPPSPAHQVAQQAQSQRTSSGYRTGRRPAHPGPNHRRLRTQKPKDVSCEVFGYSV